MEVQDQTKNGLWDDPWIQDSRSYQWAKLGRLRQRFVFSFNIRDKEGHGGESTNSGGAWVQELPEQVAPFVLAVEVL